MPQVVSLALLAAAAACAAPAGKRGLTARDLATLTDIKTVSVSPDKRFVAYQTYQPLLESNTHAITWHVAEVDPERATLRGAPQRIADGGEPIFGLQGVQGGGINGDFYGSEAVWAPDGRRFAYTLKKNGEIQLWMSRVDAAGQKQLTHSAADIRSAAWSRDGSKLYFSVDRKRSDLADMHREQSRGGYVVLANAFAFSIDMPAPPPCQDDDSHVRVQQLGYLDSRTCRTSVWALHLADGTELPATPQEEQEFRRSTASEREVREQFAKGTRDRRMPATTADGERHAWAENVDPDVFKGYLPPLRLAATSAGRDAVCEDAICTSTFFQNIWWSRDEREVIVLAQTAPKHSITSLYVWQPGARRARVVLQTDAQLEDCRLLLRHLLCVRQAWTRPGRLVSVDLASGRIIALADPNPEIRNVEFTRVEKHVWKDAHGNTALGHLVYPSDFRPGTRYPMIITTYRSGGFLRGAVGDEQPIHVFARNGFFVLSFDVPDDEESDARVEDPLNLHGFAYPIFKQGPQSALDLKIDELDRLGLIDPRRVGITSFSYGANIVDTALVKSKRFAAASAAWSPLSPAWLNFASTEQKRGTERLYGGDLYGSGLARWRETAIAFNAHRIDVPFLIQVADREYFGSLQNFMALRNAGKPVEMLRFPDEYHVKWQPWHRFAVYNRNVDWFNFWLRGIENPTPLDADQYVRWRQLREQHQRNLAAAAR